MTERPDLDALTADYLHLQMLLRVRAAEKAEAAYQRREAEITARHRRKSPLDPKAAHINAAIQQVDDPLLRLHGFMTGHHRDWARTYAEVLMADIAHRSQGRPFPPDGRRPAPGSAAAARGGPAVSESPGGVAPPSGAGVSSDPRPRRAQREPDGNGVRPGAGPFQVGTALLGGGGERRG